MFRHRSCFWWSSVSDPSAGWHFVSRLIYCAIHLQLRVIKIKRMGGIVLGQSACRRVSHILREKGGRLGAEEEEEEEVEEGGKNLSWGIWIVFEGGEREKKEAGGMSEGVWGNRWAGGRLFGRQAAGNTGFKNTPSAAGNRFCSGQLNQEQRNFGAPFFFLCACAFGNLKVWRRAGLRVGSTKTTAPGLFSWAEIFFKTLSLWKRELKRRDPVFFSADNHISRSKTFFFFFQRNNFRICALLRCGDGVLRCFQDDCSFREAHFQRWRPFKKNSHELPVQMVGSGPRRPFNCSETSHRRNSDR